MTLPRDDEIWGLYQEALVEALLLPDLESLLVATRAVPLLLYTATRTIPPVPTAQALDQVFACADAVPEWGQPYRPRPDGGLTNLYRAFVADIKKKNEPIVARAAARLAELDRQLRDGVGELVMTTEAGSTKVVRPRYDPAPLGSPGFSGWLDIAILTYDKLPPAIDLVVDRQSTGSRSGADFASAPPFFRIPGIARDDVLALRLTIHSLTTVSTQPGGWLDPTLFRSFVQASDFKPGTLFASQPIWGPKGTLGVLAVGLAAGFRPVVEVEVARAGGALAKVEGLLAGPFRLEADPDQTGLGPRCRRFIGPDMTPMLLGVSCDRPNRDL